MAIEIKCNCGSEYRLDDSRAGQEFTCKVCQARMRLPTGSPRAVPPPVVLDPEAIETMAQGLSIETGAASDLLGPGSRESFIPAADLGLGGPAAGLRAGDSPAPVVLGPAGVVEDASQVTVMRWASPRAEDLMAKRPSAAWFAVRGLIWLSCMGFLWAPWFTSPKQIGASDQVLSRPMTGWQVLEMSIDSAAIGIRSPRLGSIRAVPAMIGLDAMPTDRASLAGLALMAFSPGLYGLALVLGVVMAFYAFAQEGKGMGWPFLLCWLSLLCFLVGWLLVGQALPLTEGPTSIGISTWLHLMLLALIPMTLVARMRPDFDIQATEQMVRREGQTPQPQ